MNEIFRVQSLPDDFRPVWYRDEDEPLFDLLRSGQPVAGRWRVPHLTFGGKARRRETPDFPGLLDHILIASGRAWQVLRPLIGDAVEPLPVIHPSGEEYHALNVVRVIDCLIVDRCRTNRPPGDQSGYFSRVYTYAFNEEAVRGEHVFRCPQMKGLEVYVSSAFKEQVEAHGLLGLKFVEIYPVPTE